MIKSFLKALPLVAMMCFATANAQEQEENSFVHEHDADGSE